MNYATIAHTLLKATLIDHATHERIHKFERQAKYGVLTNWQKLYLKAACKVAGTNELESLEVPYRVGKYPLYYVVNEAEAIKLIGRLPISLRTEFHNQGGNEEAFILWAVDNYTKEHGFDPAVVVLYEDKAWMIPADSVMEILERGGLLQEISSEKQEI